jgi:small basic protein (TIGR04137 family)
MSQHPSLKASGGTTSAKRSVMKRFERVKLMKKRGQWKQGQSPIGLAKTRPEL